MKKLMADLQFEPSHYNGFKVMPKTVRARRSRRPVWLRFAANLEKKFLAIRRFRITK